MKTTQSLDGQYEYVEESIRRGLRKMENYVHGVDKANSWIEDG